jgi:processive 1,2-diacylglycerol beta-glucosyltransferase
MAAAGGNTAVVAVATDFAEHPYWPIKDISAFVVAGDTGRRNLLRRGLDTELVYPHGIPIRPIPAAPPVSARENGHLQVLVMAGGGQMGPYMPVLPKIKALLRRLAAESTPGINWKFVFGNNRDLLRQAREWLVDRPDVELLGFVPDLPDHLAAADLLVTKPGGLTLAEACGMGKPLLLLTRGAGQEHANAGVILEAGAGYLTPGASEILDSVRDLFSHRGRLEQMAGCARELGRPQAAENTARLILSLRAGKRL